MKAKMEQFPAANPNPVLRVEKDGTLLYSNEAGEPLLHEWGARVGKKLPSCIGDLVKRVICRNSPEKMEVKAGTRVYLVSFHPLPEDESVNIYGFDISDRKELEEKLRESEEKYRNIVEIANEGIWILDTKARTTYVNEKMAEMLGYSQDEMVGRSPCNFVDEEFEFILKLNLEKRKQGINQVYELKLTCKDSSLLWALISTKAIFNKDGKFAGSLSVLTDITERKEAEEALKKARDSLEEKIKERTIQLEKAYESLKESEQSFAEAQKMAHVGNWDWDVANDKAYWSEEMYRIFGRNPEESAPAYNEYLNYTHPDDRDYVDNALKESLSRGKPCNIDYRIVLANGEIHTIHMQSRIIFDEENVPVRMRGIVQDITERKKAEEKIQILVNAVESSNDAILTESLEGIVTSWNKGAEQVYGYSAEEILGKNISIVEPDNLKGEIKRFSEKIKQGKKIQSYETLRLKKDGTIINVSVTLSPIFDASGELMAISAIARDITEQERAEETLRESEARLRRFYESGLFGMHYYKLNGSITGANDKFLEIIGYTREDLQAGRINWDKMTPPEYRLLDEHAIAELRATGVATPFEKEYIRKDGSRVPIILGVATFDQARNEGIAFVLDITEKKKAEEALARSEEARKKEIHHRIKNNLQVISSLLDLQAEKFRDKEVLEAFKESKNRVFSMSLIHEELYKGEGTDKLDFSAYLQKLAKSLFQTYSLSSKSIRLCMDLEENAFFNMDVAIPLGIVVNELVSNSLKYAFHGRNGGEIRIQLYKEKIRKSKGSGTGNKNQGLKKTGFILKVSDDGIGIPESFDLENPDTLGMQLITTLVEQLDGELELNRKNGTKFTIRFAV
ncbi:sensory transduction histidine kinase [Methanosarcina horonobensis HB-1 = JCM 15518]|uniref:Sensory transduction histidine kinase n=1 Tax=Methanosarcina horonobensis HB-1 = JCM 15518 TaxID=1434110 RepID=A0A0E3S9S0_9EURY|nr:PAS domain S-box protein [Methanosarcina horonobensis]AKB77481.1 sensory transduction histidine kinase [Methanosarcina horonobensis HB-1 = JCM 15518]